MRKVALSQRETRKGKRASGVGGNRNPDRGHLPVDPKWQPARKEQDLAVGILCSHLDCQINPRNAGHRYIRDH
jgi:hypothetical protein